MLASSYAKLVISALIASVLTFAGWYARGVIADRDIAEMTAEAEQRQSAAMAAATEAYAKVSREREQHARQIAEIDAKYTQEKVNADQQIEDLRESLRAGARRLRIAATCPAAPAGHLPGAASTPGVGDAGAPQLTADAERAYFRLRTNIADTERQLTACQDIIRASLPTE